jgi:CheY-like chemotaxis protein
VGHRILLVEDDEMNRDMLSVNGLEGLALARAAAPDLILMDISLPELDGWEATRRLKGDQATSAIPVLVLTAHAMAGDAERFFEAGCDAYESKPIDWQRLMIAITALLNTRTS